MNRDKVKEILDKTNIYVLDEANIIEYIDELENKINKAIEYIEKSMNNPQPFYKYIIGDENGNVQNLDKLLDILRGEDNEII